MGWRPKKLAVVMLNVLNDRFEGFDDHDILYEEIQTKAG